MIELSPATQAVLDAFTEDNCLHDWKHNHYNIEALAVALRAAAKPFHWTWNAEMCYKHLCDIAAELELEDE